MRRRGFPPELEDPAGEESQLESAGEELQLVVCGLGCGAWPVALNSNAGASSCEPEPLIASRQLTELRPGTVTIQLLTPMLNTPWLAFTSLAVDGLTMSGWLFA